MRVLGAQVERPRPGQWVAAAGLAAALVGTQAEYLAYEWYGKLMGDYFPRESRRDTFIVGEAWSRWSSYAILAIVVIALVAALVGATLVSLSGSMLALGGVVILPLAILKSDAVCYIESPYYLQVGYFIMAAGLALGAYGSSIDVRQRFSRHPSREA